jgi:hypothetical protein
MFAHVWRTSFSAGLAAAGLALGGCAAGAQMSASAPAAVMEAPPPAPAAAAESSKGYVFSDAPIAGGALEAKSPPEPVHVNHHGVPPTKPTGPTTRVPPTSGAPTSNPPPATTAPQPRREALLIYTAVLTLAVYQVDASLAHIEELARGMGGYLASRTDTSIVVRVPRARFQDALTAVVKLGDVLHRDIEAQDVSDRVVDLEARLKNARAVRDRLAQLLQGATATKDALEIEKELARVMGQIEVMEGQLQLFADKIAYSTVTVNFQPLHTSDVHALARLPFPWLSELGLAQLLEVK